MLVYPVIITFVAEPMPGVASTICFVSSPVPVNVTVVISPLQKKHNALSYPICVFVSMPKDFNC